jgi:predicted aspartyl protease
MVDRLILLMRNWTMLKPRNALLCGTTRWLGIVLFALSSLSSVLGQTIKATVASTTLYATSFRRWTEELGCRDSQQYALVMGGTGCPFVKVKVAGVSVSLMLDTGTARGFFLTTSAPSVPHSIDNRTEELNADGTHRGESLSIHVDTVTILGKIFNNIHGSLSDWHLFSSEPFDGAVGLDFFLDRRLTLDYRSLKAGITTAPIPVTLDGERYVSLDLVEPPPSQGHVLYVRANVNGRDAIVYIDTGYNVSFIDPAFGEGLARVERQGKFRVFRQHVPVRVGKHEFVLDELRESPISRGPGFDLPVALTLGSDILSHFVLTVDLRAKKLILAMAG